MKRSRLRNLLYWPIQRVVFCSLLVIVMLAFAASNELLTAQQQPEHASPQPTRNPKGIKKEKPAAASADSTDDKILLKALLEKMSRLEKAQDELAQKLEGLEHRVDQFSAKPEKTSNP